ncbi:MAG TPA: hypothetical protein VFJ84_00525, partial [Candidatus Saccharimonadales bacterium]|nr:hypothetical protein [Candidatus Saccharimonadales bacterium]
MPPGQTISPQEPGSAEPVSSAAPQTPLTQPQPSRSYRKIIIIAVAVAVLAALGGAGFAFNQKRVANQKFSQLAADIKRQELDGLDQYAKVASITNDLGNMIDLATSDNPPADIAQKLTGKVSTLKSSVDGSCSAKSADLTESKINDRVSGVKLNADQEKYVSDMKDVISGLEGTGYSNAGMCTDGPALVSFADNFSKILPGLNALGKVGDSPTPAQLQELKKYADLKLTDDASLKAKLPQTWQMLTDLQAVISGTYNTLNAVANNDYSGALLYGTQLEQLSAKLQTDMSNFTAEINSLDKAENAAATKASLAEISAIEYQKNKGIANPDMQLDLAVPSFRIADASITSYDDEHDHYPAGTSVNDIAGLDENMQKLKDKDLLKNLTYSGLGS